MINKSITCLLIHFFLRRGKKKPLKYIIMMNTCWLSDWTSSLGLRAMSVWTCERCDLANIQVVRGEETVWSGSCSARSERLRVNSEQTALIERVYSARMTCRIGGRPSHKGLHFTLHGQGQKGFVVSSEGPCKVSPWYVWLIWKDA